MEHYIIKQTGWIEDGFGVSAYRAVGEQIQLLPGQASYLLLSSTIAPAPPSSSPAPAPPPVEPAKPVKAESKNVRD